MRNAEAFCGSLREVIKMASEGGDNGSSRDGAATNDESNGHTTKRQRMDRLIEMSMAFAGVHEAHRAPQQACGTDPLASRRQHCRDDHSTVSPDERDLSIRSATTTKDSIVRKRTWTAAEDATLMDLVQRLGRDWAAIARELPTRDRKRCRERFINHLDPALNRLPWSQAEDDKLRKLRRECGSQWTRLASELRGRSPEDTKNRWLHLTADNPQTRAQPQRWTVAETEALASLVEANGAKDWFFIASQIPGRTDLQCRQHWHRVLAPNITKGRTSWTRDEDDLLRAKVEELGPHWEQIAAFLPGRLGKQCRERYLNHLDAAIVTTPWTPKEDAILLDAHTRHPQKWTRIAQELPGRTENAVKNRWNSLRRRTTANQDG